MAEALSTAAQAGPEALALAVLARARGAAESAAAAESSLAKTRAAAVPGAEQLAESERLASLVQKTREDLQAAKVLNAALRIRVGR